MMKLSNKISGSNKTKSNRLDDVVERVEKYINEFIQVRPIINNCESGIDEHFYSLANVSNATNAQLEEYLEIYGGIKSYLEHEISLLEAKQVIFKSVYEDSMTIIVYELTKDSKRPVKDYLRGEALRNNGKLMDLRDNLLETNAECIRVKGLLNSYSSAFTTISRIVTVRSTSKDQV